MFAVLGSRVWLVIQCAVFVHVRLPLHDCRRSFMANRVTAGGTARHAPLAAHTLPPPFHITLSELRERILQAEKNGFFWGGFIKSLANCCRELSYVAARRVYAVAQANTTNYLFNFRGIGKIKIGVSRIHERYARWRTPICQRVSSTSHRIIYCLVTVKAQCRTTKE